MNSNQYFLMSITTGELVHRVLKLAVGMAKRNNPSVVGDAEFALKRMEEDTEVFTGDEYKPKKIKKAYKR